ncbi:MAG: glycoside hydrolase family 127 protein [Sedimentisphaerales bacterium]|nr:glycoside hydrolase family 127 protein [Sedimentisphaerales bacterium]
MKRKSIKLISVSILIVNLLAFAGPVFAQVGGGDQFLDGIGETALVARYILNGNAQDWSRNNYHATLHGDGAAYVEDSLFGKVLSLPGQISGGYLQIPGRALIGIDTISVTGWLFLRDEMAWQRFFDFGQDTTRNFFCTPVGEEPAEGYRARVTITGWNEEVGPVVPRVATGKWVHLAVVLDTANQTLSSYMDGKRVARENDVDLTLEQVLNQDNAAANLLYIGKSEYETDPDLNAKVHDVRIYSIALTDRQVATIRNNATPKDVDVVVADDETAAGDESSTGDAASKALQLVAVPDITAETTIGVLPRLPYYIPGTYRDGAEGPLVRVLWPAPTDNSQVREAGTYTVTGTVPGTDLKPKATVTVKASAGDVSAPQLNLQPFGLGQVVLNQDADGRDTQFMKNRDKFILTLAGTNPDSFLFNFRDAFGQEQPEGVRPLRGWDSRTTRLRGHASGHYLSAMAQAYASTTYDADLHANFLQKMNYMIDTLYEFSQKSGKPVEDGGEFNADPTKVPPGPGKEGYDSDLSENGIRTDYWNWGEGFISAYPPDQFIMLENGATYGGRNNQIWAPYYTLHKILAGLLDCYEVGGNEKALKIAEGMGNWVYERLKVVPTETRISMWNRYIAGEYGGMNEVMARLHRITGKQKYLDCARLFDNIDFFFGNAEHDHGLAKNVDTMRSKHANQHIPQITGAVETYKGTKDIAYYEVADNFWDICSHCYMYSIGGVAGAKNPNNSECFTAQPNTLFTNGFNQGGQNETCATYNLLKLSRQLFMFDQDGKYMDYYEQGLYNHILASVAENDAGNTYHVPLNPGARKRFGNANMSGFTCCNGTALESNTKLQDSIYFKSADNNTLYVNLYVPSTLTWPEQNVVVKQSTNYPYADTTKLTITGGGKFDIKVRVPKWARRGFFFKINDSQIQAVDINRGEYLTLRRTWRDGDTIELKMPFSFYLRPVMDQPNIASIFYGPVLLAAQEPGSLSTWRPVTLDAGDIGKSITGDPATLSFRLEGVELKPFFETYGRHSVYFDVTLK